MQFNEFCQKVFKIFKVLCQTFFWYVYFAVTRIFYHYVHYEVSADLRIQYCTDLLKMLFFDCFHISLFDRQNRSARNAWIRVIDL